MADNWYERIQKLIYGEPELGGGTTIAAGKPHKPRKYTEKERRDMALADNYWKELDAQLYLFINSGKFKNYMLKQEAYEVIPQGSYQTALDSDKETETNDKINALKDQFVLGEQAYAKQVFENEGIYSPNLPWLEETIQPQIAEYAKKYGKEVAPGSGIYAWEGNYYDNKGVQLSGTDLRELTQQLLSKEGLEKSQVARIEQINKQADERQQYFDVQKEWQKSLDTPWVTRPGETLKDISPGRQLEIPERIWTDPNFQKAYEANLAEIRKTEVYPSLRGGQAITPKMRTQAEANVPESTQRMSEQLAEKRALAEYRPPTPMTGRAAGYESPAMGENWASMITPKPDQYTTSPGGNRWTGTNARSAQLARERLAEQKERERLAEFKGFMQYMSGVTPDDGKGQRETKDYGFGAMSTAEQQALMGKYEEKYDVKEWPILPSGQQWYTMPWKQRGDVMGALTSGWGAFGDKTYRPGRTSPNTFAEKYATPPKGWKPRYTSPEEAQYFMNMAPRSSGLSTSRRSTKQRA